MEPNYKIETIGLIEKKVRLSPIGYSDFVLESTQPYPGYHGTTVPDSDQPWVVYFIIKGNPTAEFIIRKTQEIKKNTKIKFDGVPGLISIFNEMVPCIRIRDFDNYDYIPTLLELYKKSGISFVASKKMDPYDGVIRIKKHFYLEPINDYALQDIDDKNMKYFPIPTKLSWDQFEKIDLAIKSSIDDSNFDAALATIFRKDALIDYIRIYDSVDSSIEKLMMIREKYLQELKRVDS